MNGKSVIYALPGYAEEIINTISHRKWLVHNFNISNEIDLYNPAEYLYCSEFEQKKYNLVLDLNVYQFLLKVFKKDIPKPEYRNAAALLVFCQMANIEIDPTCSVYERVNYKSENLSEAIQELELFHQLNNSEMESLAKYALGYSDAVKTNESIDINLEEISQEIMRYRKLTEWDSLYVMMLCIVDIRNNKAIPDSEKLTVFINWLVKDFRLSIVAITYALVLFSKRPIKRMMKYKRSLSLDAKRASLHNMTWDLYVMKDFFDKWTSKNLNEEFMFASDDKAFSLLLRMAIEIQMSGNFEPVKNLLSSKNYKMLVTLLDLKKNKVSRIYNTESWGVEHRSSLIKRFEENLLC